MIAPHFQVSALTMVLVAATMAVGAGCASSGYPGLSTAEQESRHASIRVRNDNWQDIIREEFEVLVRSMD